METKNWNVNEWENYLKEIESPQTELLLDDPNYLNFLSEEKFKEGVSELIGTNYSSNLNAVIVLLMERLTKKQRTVLDLIFWQSKTLREVADILQVRHTTVQDLRDRALASLARTLINSTKKKTKSLDEAA